MSPEDVMKMRLFYLMLAALLFAAVGCSEGDTDKVTEKTKESIEQTGKDLKDGIVEDLDSVASDLEETAKELKEKSETVKNAVDELLKDI